MVPALIVGAATAWYLGLRTGIIVAVAVFLALVVANFVPGATYAVYALVLAWGAVLYFLGPKISKLTNKGVSSSPVGGMVGGLGSAMGFVQGNVSKGMSWAKNLIGGGTSNDKNRKAK